MKKKSRSQNNLIMVRYLQSHGYTDLPGFERYMACWCKIKNIQPPIPPEGKKARRSFYRSFVKQAVAEILKERPALDVQVKKISRFGKVENTTVPDFSRFPTISQKQIEDFYSSWGWKKLALECKLRDGRKCMCCGTTPKDGVRIVSDHIKPIRYFWSLRLDANNIQTLCDDCNMGKSSQYEIDFT